MNKKLLCKISMVRQVLLHDNFVFIFQDWDFPHFIGAIDIKLPGVNKAHIRFKIPKLLKKLEHWEVHISGKKLV